MAENNYAYLASCYSAIKVVNWANKARVTNLVFSHKVVSQYPEGATAIHPTKRSELVACDDSMMCMKQYPTRDPVNNIVGGLRLRDFNGIWTDLPNV